MDRGPPIDRNDEHQVVLPARHAHTTATLLRAMVCLQRFKSEEEEEE